MQGARRKGWESAAERGLEQAGRNARLSSGRGLPVAERTLRRAKRVQVQPHRRPSLLRRMCFSSVVLPEPRNPAKKASPCRLLRDRADFLSEKGAVLT